MLYHRHEVSMPIPNPNGGALHRKVQGSSHESKEEVLIVFEVCRQKTNCQPVTTPIMRHWAESIGPPQEEVEQALQDI